MHLQIENLSFQYDFFGTRSNPVLRNIHLNISQGDFIALVGSSGSGKTTLMQHLTGLLKPQEGRILVDGENIWAKHFDRSELRRKIGLVFQFPEAQLFEESVFSDIAFGPQNLGLSEKEVRKRVTEAMETVGLDPTSFRDRLPFNLSEGEKRRAAIAGVLAMQPLFLALDEPTAGMDHAGVNAIKHILQNYHRQGKTVLLISHNLDFVSALVQRLVVIHQGAILFDDDKDKLFDNPTLLKKAGLAIPRTKAVLDVLEQHGWVNSTKLYDLEDIKKALAAKMIDPKSSKKTGENKSRG
ncbi:MAG: ATP-binding cassette domain-containing protein [bacterium]